MFRLPAQIQKAREKTERDLKAFVLMDLHRKETATEMWCRESVTCWYKILNMSTSLSSMLKTSGFKVAISSEISHVAAEVNHIWTSDLESVKEPWTWFWRFLPHRYHSEWTLNLKQSQLTVLYTEEFTQTPGIPSARQLVSLSVLANQTALQLLVFTSPNLPKWSSDSDVLFFTCFVCWLVSSELTW